MKTTIQKESTQVFQNVVIPTGKKWRPQEDTNHSIVETGSNGKAMKLIVAAIEAAHELICVCSFIMDSNLVVDALKVAADRGVKVYILGSASAKLQDEIEEEERTHRKSYEQLLIDVFQSRFLFRSAEYLHAKFILIDPKTNPTGFMTTCNFTQKAFTENPELVVKLNETQTIELYQAFVYHFWEQSTHEQGLGKEFSVVRPFGVFSPPKLQNVLLTSPQTSLSNLKTTLAKAIANANRKLIVSTFSIDAEFELTKLIQQKVADGVDVTLFTRCLPKQLDVLFRLRKAGVKVLIHPLLHAKFIVTDETNGFIFTANLKSQGMDSGMEVGIKLHATQVAELMKIAQAWENGFSGELESELSILEAPDEFDIFRNAVLVKERLESFAKTQDRKNIGKLKDLRIVHTDLEKAKVPEKVRKLEHTVEFVGGKLPETFDETSEIVPLVRLVTWNEGEKTKEGLFFEKGFDLTTLKGISTVMDHLPVFFEG